MTKVVYEGWMVRYGRRRIGRSFIHKRYFVLESRLLAYYKREPQDNVVPIKTLLIDGNCRVEDRGRKMHHGHYMHSSVHVRGANICAILERMAEGVFLRQTGHNVYVVSHPNLTTDEQNEKMVYVLSIYNKKEKNQQMTMAAFSIQDALIWKEKIESVIYQHQDSVAVNGSKAYSSLGFKTHVDERTASSSDHESQCSGQEDEVEDNQRTLLRRTTIGNGPPDSIHDWTHEVDPSNPNNNDQVFSRKHWRLIRCQNGLRIFEELIELDYLPRSCSRAMKAVGVVEATCEAIFELVMGMDWRRFEWDCTFQYGSLVQEVDGHTAILYQRLQLDWFPMIVWPRDLCYVRYWRRNDNGSYVVLFRSKEHPNCGPQPGFVRAHIESGGFIISSLRTRNGRPRSKVQHLMQIDLKGWGVGYFPSFQQHCLLQMLNNVAGLREWFSQTEEDIAISQMPVMSSITASSLTSKKEEKNQELSTWHRPSVDQMLETGQDVQVDEDSEEDEDFQIPDEEVQQAAFKEVKQTDLSSVDQMPETGQDVQVDKDSEEDEDCQNPDEEVQKAAFEEVKQTVDEEKSKHIDLSFFSGNLRRDDCDTSRNCWRLSDGNNFRVRSKYFLFDKSKIPAGNPIMELVAVDWFKDTKRMDYVARREGCAVQVASEKGLFSLAINLQVPGSTHYSMVFYFVTRPLVPGSLLQQFVDGDDEFRNSRLKLIPSVPKGSWIVRQSVGSTPCLLGKAVDCNYIRGPKYLEIDVDIGSSAVANGVLGLVCGVITTLVVDMAFLIQANTEDELPEQLIGAVRVAHVKLSSAINPLLYEIQPGESIS